MEHQNDTAQLLDLMVRPAFCVKDGRICHANPEAARSGISAGEDVHPLLATGQQEYRDFKGGNLYLTLRVGSASVGATVSRLLDHDIFVLDQDDEQAQLQTMALAAQELRTPLSNIMTVADDLFPLAAQSQDPAAQELAARINRGLYQMLRIVGNMSDAYRYSKDTQPRMEYRNICSVWDEFWNRSAHLVRHADITLQYTGLKESITCLIDAEKLERAANNMLSNAIKFTPKGGTIHVRLTRTGDMLYLTVQNSGTAIPEELRGSLHNRYLRQPGVEDSRYGIGLGMVLIRSAAAAHGGAVLMEHLPEQGTRITMTMQIRQDGSAVRSPVMLVDYAGEWDHNLMELSEILPTSFYGKDATN